MGREIKIIKGGNSQWEDLLSIGGGVTDNQLLSDSDHPLSNKAAFAEFLRQQNEINTIKQTLTATQSARASTKVYGMTKLTTSTNITDPNICALSGTEKNAGMVGTLANSIAVLSQKIETNLANCYYLSGGISIPENSDLNTYYEVGNYYCKQNTTVATLKNCPIIDAFTLKIEKGTGIAYPIQTLRNFVKGDIYFRIFDGIIWQHWRSIMMTELSI